MFDLLRRVVSPRRLGLMIQEPFHTRPAHGQSASSVSSQREDIQLSLPFVLFGKILFFKMRTITRIITRIIRTTPVDSGLLELESLHRRRLVIIFPSN